MGSPCWLSKEYLPTMTLISLFIPLFLFWFEYTSHFRSHVQIFSGVSFLVNLINRSFSRFPSNFVSSLSFSVSLFYVLFFSTVPNQVSSVLGYVFFQVHFFCVPPTQLIIIIFSLEVFTQIIISNCSLVIRSGITWGSSNNEST